MMLRQQPKQRGFTLLEVLVAMALIGIGFATAFVALSGSRRLGERAMAHEIAMQLARAKLDEVLNSKSNILTEDPQELRYAGQLFGYQVKIRPVAIPLAPTSGDALVEDVGVEVFWGDKDKQQSYQLATMRMTPKAQPPAMTASAPASAAAAAASGAAAASTNPFAALLK